MVGVIFLSNTHAATCEYIVKNEWSSGFVGAIKITNNGNAALNGWQVNWTYSDGSVVSNSWGGVVSGSNPYTATNASWNANVPVGQSVEVGFQGTKGVANGTAETPVVTGEVCSAAPPVNQSPVAVATSSATSGAAPLAINFDASASTDADNNALTFHWEFGDGATGAGSQPSHTYTAPGAYVATVTVSDGQATDQATIAISVTDGGGSHIRVDNPFRDAIWYVNPEWSAKAAAEPGGSAISNISTAVWMDRIGAIEGTGTAMGLRNHLDSALEQGANMFMFVVYNLPNRDCGALASSGELLIADGGMVRYKEEYINPIAEIVADPAYKDIRIVAIIEIDSLPNLVTNLHIPACQEANGDDGYREGITYALNAFAPIDNVYAYVDAAHSGWLGWDSNFDSAVDLISSVVTGTNKGWDSIAGFITNTSNYTPTHEAYLTDPNLSVGGQAVRSADFYEGNSYFDEKSFSQAFREKSIAKGAPTTIGMLIDTGRNGWGGPQRPMGVSNSSVLNTYVDNSRLDRRYHRGNWCNQSGGIGYKPWADPYMGVDAFVWVKPPGESDGISDPDFVVDPDDPAKKHDPMCNPSASNTHKPSVGTGALKGAPHAGRWHSEGFRILLQNANPPLDQPAGPPAK